MTRHITVMKVNNARSPAAPWEAAGRIVRRHLYSNTFASETLPRRHLHFFFSSHNARKLALACENLHSSYGRYTNKRCVQTTQKLLVNSLTPTVAIWVPL